MHKCDKCEREFKSKSGLSRHSKSCDVKPEEKVENENTIEEVKTNEVASTKKLSDNIIRKIEKLRDARKSTWDAESRHLIDIEIAALEKTAR